jgi:hypothetical protein
MTFVWILLWIFSGCPVGRGWELGLVAVVLAESLNTLRQYLMEQAKGDTIITFTPEDE